MSKRPSITVGIQPQIAMYSVILGAVCAVAAYTERYRRNQDEIDDQIKDRYYANVRDQQAKIPQMTQAIRGQDYGRVDNTMNKLVWGGYANVSTPSSAGGGAGAVSDDDDENDSGSDEKPKANSSRSGSANNNFSFEQDDDEQIDESQLTKRERKRRRKLRKAARKKQREEELKRLEEERQKLVAQSLTAGAAVGAVAVAASFLLTSRK